MRREGSCRHLQGFQPACLLDGKNHLHPSRPQPGTARPALLVTMAAGCPFLSAGAPVKNPHMGLAGRKGYLSLPLLLSPESDCENRVPSGGCEGRRTLLRISALPFSEYRTGAWDTCPVCLNFLTCEMG